ncbi:hypothetical protein BWI17_14965 [Betaproteobacteria bacterium GR16-43]|nr:hypothetical protein BWI17_14965 [Betaproteobacteria bacterium GR16-43]
MQLQRVPRTLLAAAVASGAIAVPTATLAADCPAGDYATLLACAAAAAPGDTITLSATVNAAITPTLDVPANVSVINNGFMLNGAIVKTGTGTLTLNGPNAPTLAVINAGTIAINQNDSLGGAAIQMNGGTLLSNSNLSISPAGFTFVSGTSKVSAVNAGQLGISGLMTLQAGTTAAFGDATHTGSVFLGVSGASSADATSQVTVNGALVNAASSGASQIMAQAASVTVNSGGIRTNGGPLTIGNLQGSVLTSITMAGPSPQALTILSGSYGGTIGGNAILTKNGPGTFVMSGLPAWTSGTFIQQGTLQLGNINAITFGGSITVNGTLAIDSANSFQLIGSINGTGGLVKSGTGTLTVAPPGGNTYQGTTRINAGTLSFFDGSSLGNSASAVEMNGGTLQLGGSGLSSLDKPFSMIGGSNRICAVGGAELRLTNAFSGLSGDTHLGGCVSGTGVVTFAGHASFDPGALFIDAGTVNIQDPFDGNMFRVASSTTLVAGATLNANVTIPLRIFNLQGLGTVFVAGNELQLDQGNYDGVIGGPGAVRILGFSPGVVLSGDSTYAGSTFVQGKLTVGAGAASGRTGSGNIQQSGQMIYNRSGALDIPNVIDGSVGLQFMGGGTFTLSGTGSNTGTFRTDGPATLVVTGTYLSARPQLNNIGVLRGTGRVQGFQGLTGSVYEPGTGTATGVFTVDQPSWPGVTYRVKLNGPAAGTQYDQTRIDTVATFSPALNVVMGYTPAPGTTFVIVDNQGAGPIGGIFTGMPEGTIFAAGGTSLRVSYVGGTGNDVTLTAVAVPGAPVIGTATLLTPTSARVTFTAPASDGGSPILDYTATCGGQSATGAGSPLTVTGIPAGPTTCVVRARNAVGNSPNSAAAAITPGLFNYSGTSPTGTGTISIALTGGGGACQFSMNPAFIPLTGDPASPPAGTAPANVDFPHGLVKFAASGCTPGSAITIAIAYPAAIPANAVYWKYGPTAATPAPHWYTLPATIAGNTVTISIVDGGVGDDDMAANGTVTDPGGIAVPKAPTVVMPKAGPAYQALWWADPPGSENGWGLNTTHQGNTIFATWFTYDANGDPMWLVMPNAQFTADGIYAGPIYRTTGPAFDSVPFDPAQVRVTPVGDGQLTFTSPTSGTFAYILDGVSQVKRLVRQEYASPVPTCSIEGAANGNVNYQDLWWGPNGVESGWGLNIVHQGDTLFVTWFTYDRNGKGLWVVMSDVRRTGEGTYTGKIYRTRGNRFDSMPWNTKSFSASEAGTATFTFTDRNRGTFAYTLDGVSQVKAIVREVFGTPAALCQ